MADVSIPAATQVQLPDIEIAPSDSRITITVGASKDVVEAQVHLSNDHGTTFDTRLIIYTSSPTPETTTFTGPVASPYTTARAFVGNVTQKYISVSITAGLS